VKMYLRSNSSKKSKLIANLMASGHICAFTKYTFKLNSLLLTGRRRIPWEMTIQPSTVSSSRPSQMLPTYLSSQEKEKLYDLLDKLWFLFKGTPRLNHQTCPHWTQIQCQAFPWMHIIYSKSLQKHDTQ
jgi:hypothetical protein